MRAVIYLEYPRAFLVLFSSESRARLIEHSVVIVPLFNLLILILGRIGRD